MRQTGVITQILALNLLCVRSSDGPSHIICCYFQSHPSSSTYLTQLTAAWLLPLLYKTLLQQLSSCHLPPSLHLPQPTAARL
ncbi:hypothetical protein B0H63DRAFT_461851 [Podospora didyma]|uniref:Uncharacterized protein n=1 Tax=Podospora didyma TaxID=330526 RepID=A0AAE0P7E2_9PEZI|nr:hypothetical protein B0H63DRAFT_461851 [Podospora didyma]